MPLPLEFVRNIIQPQRSKIPADGIWIFNVIYIVNANVHLPLQEFTNKKVKSCTRSIFSIPLNIEINVVASKGDTL